MRGFPPLELLVPFNKLHSLYPSRLATHGRPAKARFARAYVQCNCHCRVHAAAHEEHGAEEKGACGLQTADEEQGDAHERRRRLDG